jgi:hypothetical protein
VAGQGVRPHALHPEGEPVGERLRGELQQQASRRTARPGVVPESAGGPRGSRRVANGLQPPAAARRHEVDHPGGPMSPGWTIRPPGRSRRRRGCVSGRGYAPPSGTPYGLFPNSLMSPGTKTGKGSEKALPTKPRRPASTSRARGACLPALVSLRSTWTGTHRRFTETMLH